MKKTTIALTIVLAAGAAAFAAGHTILTVVFGTPAIVCPGEATVEYTASSTSGQQATVVESLTGPTAKSSTYVINAGNSAGGWTVAGRTKTFDGVFHATGLADGDYSLQVCVTEAGSNGNPAKTVCETRAFTVNCADAVVNACANVAPFGEVVGNKHIETSSGVQINFDGDFGDYATIEITSDNFYASATVNRNGDSCNYHVSWKFTNENGGDIYTTDPAAGVYSAKVTGNGKTLEFPITLN
jgi:hypothetical protein